MTQNYPCHVEWGRRGVREAANRGDIIIIVDVLSFSSTVVSALKVGAKLFPYPPHLNGKEYAREVGAEFILGRAEAHRAGKATLSPVSFTPMHAGRKFVLSSLNGAFSVWIGSKAPFLLIGCLLNAKTVAEAANTLMAKYKKRVTVIPCGEQWDQPLENENTLRPAIEDYLGAGAILSHLQGKYSPEASLCSKSYESVKHHLKEYIWECESGLELRQRGFEADVKHCSQVDVYQTVPMLNGDHFVEAHIG